MAVTTTLSFWSMLVTAVLNNPNDSNHVNLVEISMDDNGSLMQPPPPPPKPVFPSKYIADVSSANGYMTYPETWHTDNDAKLQRIDGQIYDAAIKNNFNITAFMNSTGEVELLNDVCRPIKGGVYFNPLGLVELAKYLGSRMIEGKMCDLWYYNGSTIQFSLANQGNTPVVVEFATKGQKETYIFKEFRPVESFPMGTFKIPEKCFNPPPLCPATAVKTMDVYVAHPAHIYNVDNQDVADLLGDVVFICGDKASSRYNHYSLLSHFILELDPSYGVYSLCNGEPGQCIGIEDFVVGREASLGAKPNGGQCTVNDEIGNWLSLPKGGECQQGQSPSIHKSRRDKTGCTWRITKRIKTIQLSCLQDHGMDDACAADKAIPFPTATKVFQKALSECTDVPPPVEL